nr:elongation factor P [Tanacetum cinerariifolium]
MSCSSSLTAAAAAGGKLLSLSSSSQYSICINKSSFLPSQRRLPTFPKFLHVKPGKGAAYVRTTLKNHITGNSVEKTFRAGSKIEPANISKETKQFTYKDGSQFVFMDLTSYEEVRLNESDMGDKTKWLKEGMDCILLFWKGKVIDFELPIQVRVKVVEVDPGLKGDTAQGGTKPATVETGAVVNVPLFVDRGQEIVVDTRTGQYVSRV